jgi:hypothetical protein
MRKSLNSSYRVPIALVSLLLSVFACEVARPQGELSKKAAPKLEKNEFRFTLERVGEPADGFSFYLIRVWTVGAKPFAIVSQDGWLSDAGHMDPEPKTKLYRGEARVIISSMGIRTNVNEVETWVRVASEKHGAVTTSRMTQRVPAATGWTKVVQIAPKSGVEKIGSKVLLGKINGQALQLEVRQGK